MTFFFLFRGEIISTPKTRFGKVGKRRGNNFYARSKTKTAEKALRQGDPVRKGANMPEIALPPRSRGRNEKCWSFLVISPRFFFFRKWSKIVRFSFRSYFSHFCHFITLKNGRLSRFCVYKYIYIVVISPRKRIISSMKLFTHFSKFTKFREKSC